MCTLVNKRPKEEKRKGGKRERDILNIIKLDPTLNKKKPYRFRMLWFKNEELNKRSTPDVVKMIHEQSSTDDDGKRNYDYITCPSSRYINWDSNPYETCPMCATANNYFESYKASGYKDRAIQKDFDKHKAKRMVLIPVYIVQDPCNPANNGKYGTFKIREADYKYIKDEDTGKWNTIDQYEILQSEIASCEKAGGFPYNTNAVDLAVWVDQIDVDGDNKFSYSKISKVSLTKKAYEIDTITGESIKEPFGLTFDNECFTMVTKEELAAFHDKHIGTSVDIPDDDLDFDDDDDIPDVKPTPKAKPSKVIEPEDDIQMDMDIEDEEAEEIEEIDDIDVNELIDDVVESVDEDVAVEEVDDSIDELDDLDDLLDDLDI